MFDKLTNTTDNFVVTILRLALGAVFFAHGAQKALGWFGGYGLHGTLGFFTQQMHIPWPFAVLAIATEFLGSIGLIIGFLGRVAAFGIACNMAVAMSPPSASPVTWPLPSLSSIVISASSPTGPAPREARASNITYWPSLSPWPS